MRDSGGESARSEAVGWCGHKRGGGRPAGEWVLALPCPGPLTGTCRAGVPP